MPTIKVPELGEFSLSLCYRLEYDIRRDIMYTPHPEVIRNDLQSIRLAHKVTFYHTDKEHTVLINRKPYDRWEVDVNRRHDGKLQVVYRGYAPGSSGMYSQLTDSAKKYLSETYDEYFLDIYQTVLNPLKERTEKVYLGRLSEEIKKLRNNITEVETFYQNLRGKRMSA